MSEIATYLFNNENHSDIQVMVNGKKYHLIAKLLEKSPFLSSKIKDDDQNILHQMISSPDSIMCVIKKKIINIDDPELDEKAVFLAMQSLYDIPIEYSNDNINEMIIVYSKFQMIDMVNKCTVFLLKNINTETFLDQCIDILKKKCSVITILDSYLFDNFNRFEKTKLFQFITTLSADKVINILSSSKLRCSEDYVYEIANHYCEYIKSSKLHQYDIMKQCQKIMSCVRLTLLSHNILVNDAGKNPYINFGYYLDVLKHSLYPSGKLNEELRNDDIFKIGKKDGVYRGFRIITKKDYTATFVTSFAESYQKNNGIVSLDSFFGNALCFSDGIVTLQGYYLRTLGTNIKKGETIGFRASNEKFTFDYVKEHISEIKMCYDSEHSPIGLFVRENANFQ